MFIISSFIIQGKWGERRKSKISPLIQERDQVERDPTLRADIGERGLGSWRGSEQMSGERGERGLQGGRGSSLST